MSQHPDELPEARRFEIDEGFRAWYRACPCCLSEAHPEVKRALDEEAARAAEASAERG